MIFISRLEALAEGITQYSGYHNPEGALYQARNPGGLKAHAGTRMRDAENNIQFKSFRSGWDALIFDLRTKCSGKSHTTLTPQSTLKELICANGFQHTIASFVAKFLRRALNDQEISEDTPLCFFLE